MERTDGDNITRYDIKKMVALLDQELQPDLFKDYCPNGIQVDASSAGDSTIKKIVTELPLSGTD